MKRFFLLFKEKKYSVVQVHDEVCMDSLSYAPNDHIALTIIEKTFPN